MMESLIELDEELFLFLNGLGNESWDAFWLFITNKWGAIPLYALLLLLCIRFLGIRPTLLVLVFVALLITCTDQLTNFCKYGVQRFRPCHDDEVYQLMRLVKSSCGGKYGYFSAHASNSMALATFFGLLLSKRMKYILCLLLVWALLVGYSRIYVGVHYPADVVSGIFVGLIFGWLFFKLYILATRKFLK